MKALLGLQTGQFSTCTLSLGFPNKQISPPRHVSNFYRIWWYHMWAVDNYGLVINVLEIVVTVGLLSDVFKSLSVLLA